MKRSLVSLLCLCLWGVCLSAAESVFHFNTADDFKIWEIASQKLSLELVKDYAILDAGSLRFKSPKWKEGMPQWPACQAKPLVADWSPYNRLVLDITNPAPEPQRISLFVSDSKVPFRQGLSKSFTLKGSGCTRCVPRRRSSGCSPATP